MRDCSEQYVQRARILRVTSASQYGVSPSTLPLDTGPLSPLGVEDLGISPKDGTKHYNKWIPPSTERSSSIITVSPSSVLDVLTSIEVLMIIFRVFSKFQVCPPRLKPARSSIVDLY